jgi:hypothetical protein
LRVGATSTDFVSVSSSRDKIDERVVQSAQQADWASITTTKDGQPVQNLIGLALAERIISAAKDGRKFKIIVVIPAVP